MSDRRAGALTAVTAESTATSAYSRPTWRQPSHAWTVSAAETAIRTQVVASTSRLVSTASITAPPDSPTASSGTTVASATSPTAAVDRVMSHTCSEIANVVIAPPTDDSVVPAHRRRKAGDSRSGVRSARSFTGADSRAGAGLPRRKSPDHDERAVASSRWHARVSTFAAISDITDPVTLLPVG